MPELVSVRRADAGRGRGTRRRGRRHDLGRGAAQTGEDSRLTWSYLAFLVLATQLAAIGIVTDSTIAIVGAMAVGPEFGPLAALAVALAQRKWRLVRGSLLALGVGFPVAMLLAALAAWLSVPLGLFPANTWSGVRRGVHLSSRPVLADRGSPGRSRRHVLHDQPPLRRPDRRLHFGDHSSRCRLRGRCAWSWANTESGGIGDAAAAEPGGHRVSGACGADLLPARHQAGLPAPAAVRRSGPRCAAESVRQGTGRPGRAGQGCRSRGEHEFLAEEEQSGHVVRTPRCCLGRPSPSNTGGSTQRRPRW